MPPADRPIPAAPCPTCHRPPVAWSGDVGQVIRCEGCGTRFRVVLAATVSPTEGEDGAEEAAAPPARGANPYDDGYARFEETTTPGRVIALATMHFVYCGLLSVCGILSSVLLRVYPTALPGPDVAAGNRVFTHGLHALMVAASVVFLTAGLTTLRRRPSAQVWTVIALSVAGVLLVLNLADLVLNLPQFTGQPGETTGVMFGAIYQLLFWIGYLAPAGSLLSSVGRDLDRSAE